MVVTTKKWLTGLLILTAFLSLRVFAAVPVWNIVPSESSITFTGTQNGAAASGLFKKFTAKINFDPSQLNQSHVRIVVDMNSLSMTLNDLVTTLQSSDWLDVSTFPQATFETKRINQAGDHAYQAEGVLTVRGKSQPIVLHFTDESLSPTKARIKGYTMIKRTAFGIGQGEWADTNTVKDEVQVNFVVTANKG